MAINIEFTREECGNIHYFPGDFIQSYNHQTLCKLSETISEELIEHNFEQALVYDSQGCSVMIVTRT